MHADLSVHNILIFREKPWSIGFLEAIRVDRTGGVPWMRLEEARAALNRGVNAPRRYFDKHGLAFDKNQFVSRISRSLDRFEVLGSE